MGSKGVHDADANADPAVVLRDSVEEGGPLWRHLYTEEEQRAYDAACRKLHRFLEPGHEFMQRVIPEFPVK